MKSTLKKSISLILAILLVVGLFAGCGGNDEPVATEGSNVASGNEGGEQVANTEGKKTMVTVGMISFETLDPFNATGGQKKVWGKAIYEPLFCEYDGKVQGVIAKSWEWADDYTLDVVIHDNVYDSAGNHITAADVAFSYNAWKEAGKDNNANKLVSAEATGDYSVRLAFTQPYSPAFLENMGCYIVSQTAYEAAGDAGFAIAPVATGKYAVKQFTPSSFLIVEKVENHWDTDDENRCVLYSANADVIKYDVITEAAQMQTALETRTIQMGAVNAVVAGNISNSNILNSVTRPSQYKATIMFNCYEGVFKDNAALRQAVLYGMNSAEVAYAYSGGTAGVACCIGASDLAGYQTSWESEDYYNYNVDKAKQLLADAGYADGVTVKMMYNNQEAIALAAQVIMANLAEVGIKVELSAVDNTTYMTMRDAYTGAGQWDMTIGASAPKGYMVNAFKSFCDNELCAEGNLFGVNDAHLQELLETALANPTDAEAMNALHEYVTDNAWLYGYADDYNFYGSYNKIEKLVFSIDGEMAPNAFVLSADYDIFAK